MKTKKFAAMLLLLSFFGMIGLLFITSDVDNLTEQNTTEFAATVSEIRVADIENGEYIDIFTKEYDTSLYISKKLSKEIDTNTLRKGDKILFRVENVKTSFLGQAAFVDIVTLASEHRTYVSLSDYNAYTKVAMTPVRIALTVFAIAFLTVALLLFKKRKSEQKKTGDGSPS